ncbi:MAG: cupin [Candidatus Limnocylindria bacterium]
MIVKSLDDPDGEAEWGSRGRGRGQGVEVEDTMLWRSVLQPGWSWDEDMKPEAGSDSCPLEHREYVLSGRIRYVMDDGSEAEAGPGSYIVVHPGHRGFVVGDEPCVMLDW